MARNHMVPCPSEQASMAAVGAGGCREHLLGGHRETVTREAALEALSASVYGLCPDELRGTQHAETT